MSLYKRGAVWWYDFQVQGIRIRESTGLTSRSASAQAEALRKAEILRGEIASRPHEPAPKFEEFARGDFAAWSENQHREHPSTHERYMRSVKVLLRFFGNRPLNTITTADVERFKITRSREKRKNATDGRLVSPAGVNRELAVLRILFNLAIRLKKASTNPLTCVKLLQERNLRIRVLCREEETAYLEAASQPLRDVATLILETGMRPGEVFRLREDDVSLADGFLRICSGKTPFARRTIPLTQPARAVLAKRISSAESEWLFPIPWDPSRPLASVRRAHLAACKRARINPGFRLYDLRHTTLTRMAMAGIDLPTLRQLAGHANIQMTMRYVHPTPEHKRWAMMRFESFAHGQPLAPNPIFTQKHKLNGGWLRPLGNR